jgi:NAD(P)-dependent dehydrogenase (short-subunit alcohol dehydrogenase family)
VISYEGKRVVVSGGGGAGMGASTVGRLVDLGAEVHVLDLREPQVGVSSYQSADLRDPGAVAEAVDRIDGRIDCLFNCAGVPGGELPDVDVMLVNFVGVRHLTELVVARMDAGAAVASISSTGGMAWSEHAGRWLPLVRTRDFEAGRAWCQAHPELIVGGYIPSKEALIVWSMCRAIELAPCNIRVNCVSPGPTATPMLTDPRSMVTKLGVPMGRHARPEEQAGPLVWLNSSDASYVTGQNIVTDGGLALSYWVDSLVLKIGG